MRARPEIGDEAIAGLLAHAWGLEAAEITWLPLGYDLLAAVFRVTDRDGRDWFVKLRRGPIPETALRLPAELPAIGVDAVIAPVRTRDGLLTVEAAGWTCCVFPWIGAANGCEQAMSEGQWRRFGQQLRQMHDRGAGIAVAARLPWEQFDLPAGSDLASLLAAGPPWPAEDDEAMAFAAFLGRQRGRIAAAIVRARSLGTTLAARSLERVLCHGDIHAANLLIEPGGGIWMIDWDMARLAPRERDLLFVIGSRIARTVTPEEERWFFSGYGPVDVHPDALRYARYERALEDIAIDARQILCDPAMAPSERTAAAQLVHSFFEAGADLDHAESIACAAPEVRFVS